MTLIGTCTTDLGQLMARALQLGLIYLKPRHVPPPMWDGARFYRSGNEPQDWYLTFDRVGAPHWIHPADSNGGMSGSSVTGGETYMIQQYWNRWITWAAQNGVDPSGRS